MLDLNFSLKLITYIGLQKYLKQCKKEIQIYSDLWAGWVPQPEFGSHVWTPAPWLHVWYIRGDSENCYLRSDRSRPCTGGTQNLCLAKTGMPWMKNGPCTMSQKSTASKWNQLCTWKWIRKTSWFICKKWAQQDDSDKVLFFLLPISN